MIAGIDFSTHAIDVVKVDEDTHAATWDRFHLDPPVPSDAFERARNVRAAMPGPSYWDDCAAIGIEQPRGNHGVVHMARIQGAVLACIPRSMLVQPFNPSEWRTAVGLKGNASKDEIPPRVVELVGIANVYGLLGWPQDAYDAYCIARATERLLELNVALSADLG